MARDERQRDNASAGDQTEVDDPLVSNWVTVGPDEDRGDDKMAECQPVGTVRKKGIACIRLGEPVAGSGDPREQMDTQSNWAKRR